MTYWRAQLEAPLLAAVALLSACGELPPDLIHLDPRLADGRSSAEVLASRRTVVASYSFAHPASRDAFPFEIRKARTVPAPGGDFVRVGDWPREDGTFARVDLALVGSLDARSANAIELRIRTPNRSAGRLAWRSRDEAGTTREGAVDLNLGGTEDFEVVRFSTEGHASWLGRIEDLRITPALEGPQRFDLDTVSLVRYGFAPGASPGDDAGDGGLVSIGFEMRRAWPTDFGVPLEQVVRVPRGGVFYVETGLAGGIHGLTRGVRFALDLRAFGEPWTRVGAREFVPAEDPEAAGWSPFAVDLVRWEGRRVTLRLSAELTDGSAPARAVPTRAHVYFGAPRLLGLPPRRALRPNIVLVTLDTMRADRLGAARELDDRTSLTPFLDELARDGVLFTNAWTACNSTSPSHASMLTGRPVHEHGVVDNYSTLAAAHETLAELLRAEGYHTAAAVSVRHLQAGSSGFAQGFDQFLLPRPEAPVDGSVTVNAVREWLRQWTEQGRGPFFLWVHLFDPHTPYGPPRRFLDAFARSRGLPSPDADPPTLPETWWSGRGEFLHGVTNEAYPRALYGAGVAYADDLVRDLVDGIRARGLWDETAMIVAADHGESLGEHANYYHHTSLFPEVMQVPLILRVPGAGGSIRSHAPVSTIDIAATVRALAGLPHDAASRGVDLTRFLAPDAAVRGEGAEPRRLWFAHSSLQQFGCRDDEYYFIATAEDYKQLGPERFLPQGTNFLYDLLADPELLENLATDRPAIVHGYSRRLAAWRAGAGTVEILRREVSPEEQDELRRLGYVDTE